MNTPDNNTDPLVDATRAIASLTAERDALKAENVRLKGMVLGTTPLPAPPKLIGAEPVTCFSCTQLISRLASSESARDLAVAKLGEERIARLRAEDLLTRL